MANPLMKHNANRVESVGGSHVHCLTKTVKNELIDSISSKITEEGSEIMNSM